MLSQEVVAHAFKTSTWEAETGGISVSSRSAGQQSEFREAWTITQRHCLENQKL